jgi:hypothetical protein
LGTDNPLADLSTYELNGVATVANGGTTIYFAKSAYPNLDKQIQVGNTVVGGTPTTTATVTGAVFTPDGDPDNWGVLISTAMSALTTVNFSGARPITNNGTTLSNDVPGAFAPQSLVFGGEASPDYLTVGASADFNLGSTWTIEFWSNATSASSSSPNTVMSQGYDGGSRFDIFYYNGQLCIKNGTGGICAEPTPGQWTHVVLSSYNGALIVYYNGVQQYAQQVNYSLSDAGQSLFIGRRVDFQHFNGKLALIRISSTADKYTAAFTPTVTYGVEADTKLFLGGAVPFIDAKGHAVTNTGVTQSASFPVTYTVRQWLGTYTGGGNNSLFVRLSDYPDAGSIPVGANTAIGAVSVTYVSSYSGTATQLIQLDSGTLMSAGDYFTFIWSS